MPAQIVDGDLVITPAPKTTVRPLNEECGGLAGDLATAKCAPDGELVAAAIPGVGELRGRMESLRGSPPLGNQPVKRASHGARLMAGVQQPCREDLEVPRGVLFSLLFELIENQ